MTPKYQISYSVAAQLNSLVLAFVKHSGRGVGAGIHLEVADNGATRRGSALSGEERRMATHRLAAFPFTALSRGPGRMRPKENNRRPRCVRHDSNSFQEQPAKATNTAYRLPIPECPANPETKPSAKMRISHEFAVFRSRYRAVVRFGPTAMQTLATATDTFPVSTRTALAARVPCLCQRWIAAA
jgi:hypothetical protein